MRGNWKAALVVLLLMVSGCGTPAGKTQNQTVENEPQVVVDTKIMDRAKTIAGTVDGVEDTTVVVMNKDISVAVKVRGFNRLRLKKIKNEVHERIKEIDSHSNVHVTSDKKLFFQIKEIEEQIKTGSQEKSLVELQRLLNKINDDMKK